MLYSIDEDIGEDGNKFAALSCRSCEYKEELNRDDPVVYEHVLKQDKSDKVVLNPYLKNDMTLPRFTEIVCPNKECPGPKPDVVGKKIDAVELVWMYQCANCDTTWKQAARA